MADKPLVDYRRDGEVAVITLSREPLNTYDGAFHADFQQAWIRTKADDSRVVVMMATGKHFCAGAELKNPQPAPAGFSELPAWEEIRLIRSVMKPTIAAVQGGCIGGGQRMVWPCDLVFCTEDAFFRDPTASMGIGGIQSHIHTWFYGPRLAKEMIYSGMRLPAARLYAQGQVNRLYPDVETLHAETMAFAHEVAKQDPLPLRQAKRASNITMDIQGQHYVMSRMEELLDDFPRMNLRLTD
jgi:enoyl-CoA hydratase/carnithine racemase